MKKKGDQRISPLGVQVAVGEFFGTRSGARIITALAYFQNEMDFWVNGYEN